MAVMRSDDDWTLAPLEDQLRKGLGVWGLGFRVEDLGFRVWGLGFRVEVLGFEGLGFRVWGLGFRV